MFASTCTIRFRTSDDWSIANYISGIRGKEFATPYIKFINILLAKLLYYLYRSYHEINWFAVIQEIIIFLSMGILVYVLTRKLLQNNCREVAFILPFFFVGAFASTFYCRMQYTQTASVGSFSGLLLLIFSYKYDGCKMNADKAAGISLAIFSALFRPKGFLLVVPFAFVMLIDYAMVPFIKDIYENFQLDKKSLPRYIMLFVSRYRTIILVVVFILAAYTGINLVQMISYNGKYECYQEFNAARSYFIDYDKYDFEQIEEELSGLGVSRNDYELMLLWTFEDADYITADLLNSIVELQPGSKRSLRETLSSYVHGYKERNFMGVYFFTLLTIAVLALSGKNKWIYSAGLLVLLHILDFYFGAIVGRYPYWVMIGVLYSAIGTSIYLVDLSRLCRIKAYAQIILAAVLGVVLFPFGNEWYIENFNTFKYGYKGVHLYEYLNEREDDVFYIPTKNSGAPALSNGYSVFKSAREGTWRNTVSLGGWSTGHPDIEESYHALGIYSALQQIDKENVYLLSNRDYIDAYQTYLYEHTGRTSTYSLINEQYGASIYKITSDMSGETEREIYIDNINHGYNSDHDLYEISIQASVEESLTGKEFDVYLAVEDVETRERKFLMCYDAERTRFDDTGQKVILKALMPEEYIEIGKSYHVSIILANEGGNRYYTNNWEQIER